MVTKAPGENARSGSRRSYYENWPGCFTSHGFLSAWRLRPHYHGDYSGEVFAASKSCHQPIDPTWEMPPLDLLHGNASNNCSPLTPRTQSSRPEKPAAGIARSKNDIRRAPSHVGTRKAERCRGH